LEVGCPLADEGVEGGGLALAGLCRGEGGEGIAGLVEELEGDEGLWRGMGEDVDEGAMAVAGGLELEAGEGDAGGGLEEDGGLAGLQWRRAGYKND
jgi:hypothetical protein